MARPNRGGTRVAKIWDAIPGSTQNHTANGTIGGASLAVTDAATFLRMIAEYIIGPTGAVVATDGCAITVAIGIISTDAFAAGAFPDPSDEPEYPWLYWAQHFFEFGTAIGIGVGEGPTSEQHSVRRFVDSRSMRKIKPRESLIWVSEYVGTSGTPDMTVNIGETRVLRTLH